MDESPEGAVAADSADESPRRRRRPGILQLLVVILGLAVAFAYYTYVGNQRSYDSYGVLPLGSSQTVQLKSGEIRVSYREINTTSRVIGSLKEPADLAVDVYPPAGDRIELDKPETQPFTIVFHGTGHQPFGTFRASKAGEYTIVVSGTSTGKHAPAVALGKSPVAPFGSVLLGTGLILLVTAVLAWVVRPRKRRR